MPGESQNNLLHCGYNETLLPYFHYQISDEKHLKIKCCTTFYSDSV